MEQQQPQQEFGITDDQGDDIFENNDESFIEPEPKFNAEVSDPFRESSTTNFATNSQKSQKSYLKKDGLQNLTLAVRNNANINLHERIRVLIYKFIPVKNILTSLAKLSKQDRELVRSI